MAAEFEEHHPLKEEPVFETEEGEPLPDEEKDPLLRSLRLQQEPEFLIAMKGDKIEDEGVDFLRNIADPAAEYVALKAGDTGEVHKFTAAAMAREWELFETSTRQIVADTQHTRPLEAVKQHIAADYNVRVVQVTVTLFIMVTEFLALTGDSS